MPVSRHLIAYHLGRLLAFSASLPGLSAGGRRLVVSCGHISVQIEIELIECDGAHSGYVQSDCAIHQDRSGYRHIEGVVAFSDFARAKEDASILEEGQCQIPLDAVVQCEGPASC